MQACISSATTLRSTFADDVNHFADVGCPAMEVWLPKLETHLESASAADTKALLASREVRLVAAAYQGGLLLSQGEARKAHFDHFRRRLDLCQTFGIPTLLVVADFAEGLDQTALDRAVVSLRQAAQWAAGFDVTLGLEFRAKNAFCASLDTAIALVTASQESNVGVVLDAFHYYTGPSKLEDLDGLPVERLAHVQLCDLAGVARELATDADRVLPGDGDFRLELLLAKLRALGYAGWVSLELLNPILWQADPKQVLEVGVTAMRKILGLAESSA